MSDAGSHDIERADHRDVDHDEDIYNVGTAVDRHRGHGDDAHRDAVAVVDAPSWRLTINEARVLGSLIEKQFTTPDLYPLSLNGLTLACNQSTNREPVMSLTDTDVVAAMNTLKDHKLARFVHPTSGRGVTKFRQVSEDTLGLARDELAVLAALILRGPQTSAELRTRTERIHAFDTVTDVEQTLQKLHDRQPSFAVRLERQPGQKEARWQQLFAEETDFSWSSSSSESGSRGATNASNAARADELAARVASLEAVVEELQTRLARLEEVF